MLLSLYPDLLWDILSWLEAEDVVRLRMVRVWFHDKVPGAVFHLRQIQTCKTLREKTYERIVWLRLLERLAQRHCLPFPLSYLQTIPVSRLERLATASKRVPYAIKHKRPLRWRSVFPFTYHTLGHIGAATMLPGGMWLLVAPVDPYVLHLFNLHSLETGTQETSQFKTIMPVATLDVQGRIVSFVAQATDEGRAANVLVQMVGSE